MNAWKRMEAPSQPVTLVRNNAGFSARAFSVNALG